MTERRSVPGERAAARALAPQSLAIRMQRLLAAGLIGGVGVGVLAWYFVQLGDAQGQTSRNAAGGIRNAVASEMRLPALDIAAPRRPAPVAASSAEPLTRTVDEAIAAQGRAAPHAARFPVDLSTDSGSRPATGDVSSPVLVRSATSAGWSLDAVSKAMREARLGELPAAAARPAGSGLGDALQPTVAAAAEASLLATQRWLLPKGTFLDCTLETAVDSTFPGLVTCVLATDVYGADGRIVLMERGTRLVGEIRSDVRAGQARVAVLWNEARTPTGVVLGLVSPGTDALGRGGVPGVVDRHTAERFGAAVLLSVLDSAIDGLSARHTGSGGVVYNTQGTQQVATEALRNTIGIPPTIRVAAGARVMVAVVRDVDFRTAYRLVTHGAE